MFVVDGFINIIRKVVISSGNVSTLASIGGNGMYGNPRIAADSSGSVFVTDPACRILQIAVATGNISTLAGSSACGYMDGVGTLAKFNSMFGIASDNDGNLFVAEPHHCRIRQISVATQLVSSLAGRFNPMGACSTSLDGTGTAAVLNFPSHLAADMQGNLFVTEGGNTCFIRKIAISSKVVSTFAGSNCNSAIDGVGTNAAFLSFSGLVADSFGSLFVSDAQAIRIRHIDIATAKVTTIMYDGNARTLAADLGVLYIADSMRIVKLEATTPCTAGFYCPANGSALRALCEPGFYCPQGSSIPAACRAGFYCPRAGMSAESNLCTGGYFCNATGASSEIRAGRCNFLGSFCPAGSSSATQQQCTAGSFCNATGLSAVSGPCLAGYWCGAGSTSSTQNECAAGSYCVAGSSGPVLCPAGAYCALALRGDYQLCPSGTFCLSAGLTAPTNLTCVEGCVFILYLIRVRRVNDIYVVLFELCTMSMSMFAL